MLIYMYVNGESIKFVIKMNWLILIILIKYGNNVNYLINLNNCLIVNLKYWYY